MATRIICIGGLCWTYDDLIGYLSGGPQFSTIFGTEDCNFATEESNVHRNATSKLDVTRTVQRAGNGNMNCLNCGVSFANLFGILGATSDYHMSCKLAIPELNPLKIVGVQNASISAHQSIEAEGTSSFQQFSC